MYRTHPIATRLLVSATLAGLCAPVNAEFLKDSKANLELRNFYFNRDFRQHDAPQNKAEEWAQGFLLRYESGFTEGTVGFGVDAIGLLGVKLDSSPDRGGSGLLQRDREAPRRAQDEYGELGMTAKVRVSKSVLKAGTLLPKLPVLMANDSRLLPQTFEGGQLNSQEIDKLNVDLGQVRQVNQRDSTDYEDSLTLPEKSYLVRQNLNALHSLVEGKISFNQYKKEVVNDRIKHQEQLESERLRLEKLRELELIQLKKQQEKLAQERKVREQAERERRKKLESDPKRTQRQPNFRQRN